MYQCKNALFGQMINGSSSLVVALTPRAPRERSPPKLTSLPPISIASYMKLSHPLSPESLLVDSVQ